MFTLFKDFPFTVRNDGSINLWETTWWKTVSLYSCSDTGNETWLSSITSRGLLMYKLTSTSHFNSNIRKIFFLTVSDQKKVEFLQLGKCAFILKESKHPPPVTEDMSCAPCFSTWLLTRHWLTISPRGAALWLTSDLYVKEGREKQIPLLIWHVTLSLLWNNCELCDTEHF